MMRHMLTPALPALIVAALALPLSAQEADAPDVPDVETEAPADGQTGAPDTSGTGTPETGTPATDDPTDAPAADAPTTGQTGTDLPLGMPEGAATADGEGSLYVADTFGDWELRCIRTGETPEPCQLFQLLEDEGGNPVAEVSLFPLADGQQAVAGATIITPLETLLTEQLRLAVDENQAAVYPFAFCNTVGCVSRLGFTGDDISAFRRGRSATITIVPAAAPDQQVRLSMSLSGFTAAFTELEARQEGAGSAGEAEGTAPDSDAN